MRAFILLFTGICLALTSYGQPIQPPLKSFTNSVSSSVTNAVEIEYRTIMEEDDAAHEEVDKWIKEAETFDANGVGVSSATLRGRIHQRLEPLRGRYEEFLKKYPNHVGARLAFGSFLNGLAEEEKAVEQWDKARLLAPKNPASWNNLANYYGHRGPVKKAFEYYEKAIELNSTEPVYYHNLATTTYLFRQDAMELYKIDETAVFDKSFALYRQAMMLDPTNFILATDYSQNFYGTKPPRYKEGLEAWQATMKLARDEVERQGVMVHFARININLSRFDHARTNLNDLTLEMYLGIKTTLSKKLEREIEKSKKPAVIPESNGPKKD